MAVNQEETRLPRMGIENICSDFLTFLQIISFFFKILLRAPHLTVIIYRGTIDQLVGT